jgi:hypothetical protein
MLGKQGICHMLSDAATARPTPLRRIDAVHWALTMAAEVAKYLGSPPTDPGEALSAYLHARGAAHVRDRMSLPGTPCDTCVATQMVPATAVPAVMALSMTLGVDASEAFRWASRIGAIVLSHAVVDSATGPEDALSALVLSEYVALRRRVDCELAMAV